MKKEILKKSTKAIKRVDFLDENSSSVRLSNTYSITHHYNLSFDYFKFGFVGTFNPFSDFTKELLRILKVSPVIYEELSGVYGYENRIVYNENITILFGAKDFVKTKDGEDNFIFEMKGQACSEFDERNCSWLELFEFCNSQQGKATRIDFAIDDLSGKITIDELRNKVYKKEYTSRLKKVVLQGGVNVLNSEMFDDYEPPKIIESANQGFTLTFGSKVSKELCIYNKKAERISKQLNVYVDSWLRYESRYYKEYANSVFKLVLSALNNDSLVSLVFSLFRGLVEFKKANNYDFNHQYKADNWEKWDFILNDVEKLVITKKNYHIKTMDSRLYWFRDYVNITLKQLYLIDPAEFENNLKYFLTKNSDNLSNSHLADINKARIELGKEPYKNNNSAIWFLNNNVEFDDHSDLIDNIFKYDK